MNGPSPRPTLVVGIHAPDVFDKTREWLVSAYGMCVKSQCYLPEEKRQRLFFSFLFCWDCRHSSELYLAAISAPLIVTPTTE